MIVNYITKKLKLEHNSYREDLHMWEEIYSFRGCPVLYKYSIWKNGITISYVSFRKKNRLMAKYIHKAKETKIEWTPEEINDLFN